ncbi:NAD(P)H-hydrate dehydratase [Alteraurantiacibacter aquimixticola]|uniref:Bifunctional NAD(P)H-hydrate repair enzyme n=1 Tax=Alteraurantiacibacter aquimixticola TaxID=2489173 RepID=A0A4V4U8G9_9SPHN|nr:NAD(P)H-hydrate dehydratase [Alteraurantiacibacter aquimixticola]TIX49953.1 NAD(P)H-hydrate dehydratase [Alteraurantiacibacter aquimixticola]
MLSNRQILTVAQMQAAEQALIDEGESVSSLMEKAGTGAADWVWRMAAGRPVTVLCGPGNNGGDGYVIARVLTERGLKVSVVAPLEPKTDAARKARAAWGGEPVEHATGSVFVDCLFGSGLTRGLDEGLEHLLLRLARAHDLHIAVDLPSGIDADSGEVLNDVLPIYDLTIALGAWKFAHWMMPAMEMMGARRLVDIGVGEDGETARLARRPHLSPPEMDAHKYSRGLLGVIGGVMPGASLLAARAAMHGGAGYVKLFTTHPVPQAPAELVVEHESLSSLLADDRLAAILIGPGLGRDADAHAKLAWTLGCDLPTVCDADALHLLEPVMVEGRTAPLIVTPHAGELEALGNNFGSVGLDRIDQLTELAEAIEGVVVAKGPDTMIDAPGDPVLIMPPATSWLSAAGTGDVLAGLIGSRLAVGSDSPSGHAVEACWLHAEAARLAGPAFTAGDLIDYIPAAYGNFL